MGLLVVQHVSLDAASSMDLQIKESKELSLFAFPSQEGLAEDVLVLNMGDNCRVQGNPVPFEFPISVVGARPLVTIQLPNPPTPPEQVEGKTKGKAAKVEAANIIHFERLLLGNKETKSFILVNPSVLPVHWRLVGLSKLPNEFQVTPADGTIPPRSNSSVTVQFAAINAAEFSEALTVEVRWFVWRTQYVIRCLRSAVVKNSSCGFISLWSVMVHTSEGPCQGSGYIASYVGWCGLACLGSICIQRRCNMPGPQCSGFGY